MLMKFVWFLVFLGGCHAVWQTYEKPLKLATPNAQGIYVFDYELTYEFSMYSPLNNTPVVYDVNSVSFQVETVKGIMQMGTGEGYDSSEKIELKKS